MRAGLKNHRHSLPTMKILLASGVYPPDIGGPSAQTEQIARSLIGRGFDVRVVADGNPADSELRNGVPLTFIRGSRSEGRFQIFLRLWRGLCEIGRILDEFKPDVVHVQTIGGSFAILVGIATWIRRIPSLLKYTADFTVEMSGEASLESAPGSGRDWKKKLEVKALALLQHVLLFLYDRVWVTTPMMQGHLTRTLRIPAGKLFLHPNCVEMGHFETVARDRVWATEDREPQANPAPLVVLTVARMIPIKGLDVCLEALAALRDLSIKLRIVGGGTPDYEESLRVMARQLGVADRVEFVGKVAPDRIPEVYRSADIFLLASLYEPFGIVLLEAMAAGLPIVATRVGGIPEVVEDGRSAQLVPPGEPKAIADALRALIANAGTRERMSQAARQRAKEFSFDGLLDALIDTYGSLRKKTYDSHLSTGVSPAAGGSESCNAKMRAPAILSFGSTRGLWDGESAEDYRRLMAYAEHLDEYIVVANSYKRHGLEPRIFGGRLEAIPTNAYCQIDSVIRMLHIGYRVLRRRRISLIQAQDPFFIGLVAIILGRLFRVPVNTCVFGPNVYDKHWIASHWSNRFIGWIGRAVLRSSQGIQVDGQMTGRSLIASGYPPSQVHVKPMVPANLDRFLDIERGERRDDDPIRLLFAGRMATQKNLPLLLAAVSALKVQNVRRFELVLAGDGPEEENLRAEVLRDGLSAEVKFLGSVTRDEIVGTFASADIFVLISHYEGYPRVLMEAAAAALPIVSTAVSGSDEAIIDDVTGYVVPVGALDEFVERTARLLNSAELRTRMGSAARSHIRAKLDPSLNTPAQLAIWRQIIAPVAAAAENSEFVFAEKS